MQGQGHEVAVHKGPASHQSLDVPLGDLVATPPARENTATVCHPVKWREASRRLYEASETVQGTSAALQATDTLYAQYA